MTTREWVWLAWMAVQLAATLTMFEWATRRGAADAERLADAEREGV